MILLSVESDNGTVLTYRLNKTQITVGSSSRNDVVVRSPGVADRHLVIHRANGQFTFVTAHGMEVELDNSKIRWPIACIGLPGTSAHAHPRTVICRT